MAGVTARNFCDGICNLVFLLGLQEQSVKGLVIQTDQQEERDDADNLCGHMGP